MFLFALLERLQGEVDVGRNALHALLPVGNGALAHAKNLSQLALAEIEGKATVAKVVGAHYSSGMLT